MNGPSFEGRAYAPRPGKIPILAIALGLAPALFVVAAVMRFGVDVPFWDEWDLLPDLASWLDGDLRAYELWKRHNEHRIVLPRLVMFILAGLSGLDLRWAMMASVLFSAGSLALVWRLLCRIGGRHASPTELGGAAVMSALLVFSLAQSDNWIWGLQHLAFLEVLSVVAGVSCLGARGRSRRALLGGALMGLAATLTFSTGLLYWPCTVPLVAERFDRAALRTWLALGATVWLAYLQSFDLAAAVASSSSMCLSTLAEAKDFMIYVLLYIGSPVAGFSGRWAVIPGALGPLVIVAAALWLRRRGRAAAAMPWLVLAAFSAACAVLTAWGRLGHGVGQALSTRYVTFATPLWLATVGIFLVVLDAQDRWEPRARRWLTLCVLGVLAGFVLAGNVAGWREMREASAVRRRAAEDLRRGASPTQLLPLYPAPEELDARIRFLGERRLSVFRATSAP